MINPGSIPQLRMTAVQDLRTFVFGLTWYVPAKSYGVCMFELIIIIVYSIVSVLSWSFSFLRYQGITCVWESETEGERVRVYVHNYCMLECGVGSVVYWMKTGWIWCCYNRCFWEKDVTDKSHVPSWSCCYIIFPFKRKLFTENCFTNNAMILIN